jgi:hypothetical protein
MFHLYAVEIVDDDTGLAVREQLVEAETAVQARKLVKAYLASNQHAGFAYVEE